MYNYALINITGICINALSTPHEGVTLQKNEDTDQIIEITDTQFADSVVGKKYVNGVFEIVVPTQPVEPTPTPLTLEELLNQAKQNKISELGSSYYQSIFNRFSSSALGTVHTYPFNQEAQDNLRDLQNRLIADPNKNSVYFKTIEDGTLVQHTRTQFLQLMEDAETFKVQQTQKYDGLVSQVNSATTIDAVNAVTW